MTWPGTLPFNGYRMGHPFIKGIIAYFSGLNIEILGRPDNFFVPDNYLV